MLYAVYLAYHKREVLEPSMPGYHESPEYPPSIARLRVYDNKQDQWDCLANTMCPASQTIDAENQKDLELKVKEMQNNFLNEDWLEEHIRPYI